MRYWVFINNEVSEAPYEAKDLHALPGFTNETLIQPETAPEGAQQEWLAAHNFTDVRDAAPAAPPAPQEVESYEEKTDRATIPTQYQPSREQEPAPAPQPAQAEPSLLEKTLLEKLDFITRELQNLKQQMDTLGTEVAAVKSAPAPQPAPVVIQPQPEPEPEPAPKPAPAPQPAPVVEEPAPQPKDEGPKPVPGVIYGLGGEAVAAMPLEPGPQDNKDLETIYAAGNTMTGDNFLQDVIHANITEKEAAAARAAAGGTEQKQPGESTFIDLKAQTQRASKPAGQTPQPQPEAAEAAPEPVEDIKEEPLPASEELQAEELQAEPFAGERQPVITEPGQKLNEATARVSVSPNQEEDLVLKEFAQDKNIPEQKEEDKNLYIIENKEEESPVSTLEELTGRSSIPNAAPAEAGPAPQEAEDDKFLKTFTTGIEEVFMDQPTSVISDYVPPAVAEPSSSSRSAAVPAPQPQPAPAEQAPIENLTDTKHEGNEGRAQTPQPTVQSVRRIKPAAIKTVPMVSADGQDVENLDYGLEPQVEEVTIESGPSPVLKFVKMFSALIVLLVILLMFVALLAWMAIIPREWSPAHSIFGKIFKDKAAAAQTTPSAQQPSQPQSLAVLNPQAAAEADPAAQAAQITAGVKNYLLLDGMTLEEKINALHPAQAAQIQWTADAAVEPDYYSIAVKLPPNKEGYSLSYRFNYNTQNKTLAPTTSEANNLMNQRITPPAN